MLFEIASHRSIGHDMLSFVDSDRFDDDERERGFFFEALGLGENDGYGDHIRPWEAREILEVVYDAILEIEEEEEAGVE